LVQQQKVGVLVRSAGRGLADLCSTGRSRSHRLEGRHARSTQDQAV